MKGDQGPPRTGRDDDGDDTVMKPTYTYKRLRVPSIIFYYIISYICAFVQKVFL